MTVEELLRDLSARANAAFTALTPEDQAAHRREQAIDWAWGNLQASTNHKVDRSIVEKEYDRMHQRTGGDE